MTSQASPATPPSASGATDEQPTQSASSPVDAVVPCEPFAALHATFDDSTFWQVVRPFFGTTEPGVAAGGICMGAISLGGILLFTLWAVAAELSRCSWEAIGLLPQHASECRWETPGMIFAHGVQAALQGLLWYLFFCPLNALLGAIGWLFGWAIVLIVHAIPATGVLFLVTLFYSSYTHRVFALSSGSRLPPTSPLARLLDYTLLPLCVQLCLVAGRAWLREKVEWSWAVFLPIHLNALLLVFCDTSIPLLLLKSLVAFEAFLCGEEIEGCKPAQVQLTEVEKLKREVEALKTKLQVTCKTLKA
ncbi:hypothetical protein JCM10213_005808 [Rhodosporidiobolus nylandii]